MKYVIATLMALFATTATFAADAKKTEAKKDAPKAEVKKDAPKEAPKK